VQIYELYLETPNIFIGIREDEVPRDISAGYYTPSYEHKLHSGSAPALLACKQLDTSTKKEK
jgi:hypothetical protein